MSKETRHNRARSGLVHIMTVVAMLLLFTGTGALASAQQETADTAYPPAVIRLLESSVFEVIVETPPAVGVEYREELIPEMLASHRRLGTVDTHGTAFYVGDGLFVSAAHVFEFETNIAGERFSLRNTTGDIRAISEAVAYSELHDFFVFRVDHPFENAEPIPIGEPQLFSRVFSIGSARNDGLVVRDGVLFNFTNHFEQPQREFIETTIRLSPAHSGGPLVDAAGRVIGINVSGLHGEDRFQAVPLSTVMPWHHERGGLDRQFAYCSPVTEECTLLVESYLVSLPQPVEVFTARLRKLSRLRIQSALSRLHTEQANFQFPHGEDSSYALRDPPSADYPEMVRLHADSTWFWRSGEYLNRYRLANGAHLEEIRFPVYQAFHLSLPEGERHQEWGADEKRIMDLFLSGYRLERNTVLYPIRYSSLGAAHTRSDHVDRWGRKWHYASWSLDGQREHLISFMTAIPTGYLILMDIVADSWKDEWALDMQMAIDFVRFPISGSLEQWVRWQESFRDWSPFNHVSVIAGEDDSELSARIDVGWAQLAIPASALGGPGEMSISLTFDWQPDGDRFRLVTNSVKLSGSGRRSIELQRYTNPNQFPFEVDDGDWNFVVRSDAVGARYTRSWVIEHIADHPSGLANVANAVRLRFVVNDSVWEREQWFEQILAGFETRLNWPAEAENQAVSPEENG